MTAGSPGARGAGGSGALEVVLRGRDPRRAVAATVGALALGVVLVLVGTATAGAFDPTTLAGAGLALLGLGLLARLPAYFDRSVLTVAGDGLSWRGVGAGDWSVSWAEVTQVRLETGRRWSAVTVVLVDDELRLPCRPGAATELRPALAVHAPGVPVVEGSLA